MVSIRARQCLAAQKIAAVSIGDSQWLTSIAVIRHEPALEVDAPDVVGGFTCGKGGARRRAWPPLPPDRLSPSPPPRWDPPAGLQGSARQSSTQSPADDAAEPATDRAARQPLPPHTAPAICIRSGALN